MKNIARWKRCALKYALIIGLGKAKIIPVDDMCMNSLSVVGTKSERVGIFADTGK